MIHSSLVRLGALTLAALLATTAEAPAPDPLARYPHASLTDLGSLKLFSESDDDAGVSGVQIFIDAGLDRQAPAASGAAALVAECVLRTPVATPSGALPVRDAVSAEGGSLQYTVDGSSVHYYVEGRPEKLPALVTLLGKALGAPDFTPQNVAAARTVLAARIGELEGNALSVGIEMFRRSYYSSGAGMPALGSSSTVASLTSRDLMTFYQQNYKRGGLIASAIGKNGPALSDALRALAGGLPEGTGSVVEAKTRDIPETAPRIVAHRDVGAPIVVVGFGAPSPGSSDFGAMVVLESIISSAFEHGSATTLGLAERPVGAFYLYDSVPASFVVYVNGTRVDPSLALRELLLVDKSLATRPLTPDALRRFKATATGEFVTDAISLSDRTYLLGTFASRGLGADPLNAALAAVQNTTAADVQRVAKQYLQRYIVALVLPRQG
jgi:zinc protease